MYGWFTTALPPGGGSELQVFNLMLNILRHEHFTRGNRICSVVKVS